MKFRTFLPLVTYPDANAEAATENALAVSKLLNADLHALALEADMPPLASTLGRVLIDVPAMIAEVEKRSAQHASRLLTALADATKANGSEVSLETIRANPALLGERAAFRARYFDLALIGWQANNAELRSVAEAVVFASGRPTMLVPETLTVHRLEHVAIAWDGSRVAARAVADARLILERASAVSVVTVTDEKPLKEKHAGEHLAESLRKAGLKAEYSAVTAEDCPIAETLQRHAGDRGADLLVMGGYGHSRLRDFILGGATEGVLSDLALPVLLAH